MIRPSGGQAEKLFGGSQDSTRCRRYATYPWFRQAGDHAHRTPQTASAGQEPGVSVMRKTRQALGGQGSTAASAVRLECPGIGVILRVCNFMDVVKNRGLQQK